MAIRMIFDKGLRLSKNEVAAKVGKLQARNIESSVMFDSEGRVTMILQTPKDVTSYQLALVIRAENYCICPTCHTIHFRQPRELTDPFICACGRTNNKEFKQPTK